MANFTVTPTDTTFSVQVGENTAAASRAQTAAEAARDAAQASADAAAASASTAILIAGDPSLVARPEFPTKTDLENDTTITTSVPGRIWRAGPFSWMEAQADASDQDLTTAGGIKLYRTWDVAWQTGVVQRPSALTASDAGSAGNVNGTVRYSVTFVTSDGETESGLRFPIAVTNRQVSLTNIPVSSDRRVIARKIYRTPQGANEVLGQLLTTISDNVTTAFLDNVADSELGADAPWINTTGAIFKDGSNRFAAASEISTIFGQGAHASNFGYANSAFGSYALGDVTTGYRNTAIGLFALSGVTTGNANVGVGVHAGEKTTTGTSNVTIGYASFDQNALGSENVTVGNFAGRQVTGNRTVYIGFGAGQLRNAGDDNVGVGHYALRGGSTSTGVGNIGVGRSAGGGMTTGNFSTFVGHLAGTRASVGSSNSVFGANAGTSVTTGGGNLFLGAFSGNRVTTQSTLLFIDTINRANLTDAENLGLITGKFAGTRASQLLRVNGILYANVGVALPRRAVTADATLTVEDHTVIVAGTGSVTLTLPNAANTPGKVFHVVSRAAFDVVSNSANVNPIDGGAAGTAILPATSGSWAQLQSNGSTWDVIAS